MMPLSSQVNHYLLPTTRLLGPKVQGRVGLRRGQAPVVAVLVGRVVGVSAARLHVAHQVHQEQGQGRVYQEAEEEQVELEGRARAPPLLLQLQQQQLEVPMQVPMHLDLDHMDPAAMTSHTASTTRGQVGTTRGVREVARRQA
jgi:hypothetical protein